MKKKYSGLIFICLFLIALAPLCAESRSENHPFPLGEKNYSGDISSREKTASMVNDCYGASAHLEQLAQSSSREKSSRKSAVMLSSNVGLVFGVEGIGLNIDEGIEFQFSKGGVFLWGIELDYHVVFGGYGFAAKTGPVFNLTGTGPKGLLLQFYPGFKAEIITGLNAIGNFLVPIFNFDTNLVYQHVTEKGFLIGAGGQVVFMFIPSIAKLGSDESVAFGVGPILHIGYAF